MSYQRVDAPNGVALEDFEVGDLHYGAEPLFPAQSEDWQRIRPEPLGYLEQALSNSFGRRWWEKLKVSS